MGIFGRRKAALEAPPPPQFDDWQQALLQRFDLERLLGKGGYSTVYLARRLADNKQYAVKLTDLSRLTDWSRQAAVREACLLAALPHPCLPTFREAFCLGSRLCIVSEVASNGDLKSLIEHRFAFKSHLTEREVWSMLLQLALGLAHLHAHRVLHRDVKPHNVLLTDGGVAQLTDLGICGQLQGVFTRKEAGSPQYKSPEMWQGKPYSYSSDIWALGCLVHEMCTGKPLFDSVAGVELAEAEVRERVLGLTEAPRLPEDRRWSPELQEVAATLLAPDPASRPTAAEILHLPLVEEHMHLLPAAVRAHVAAARRLGGAPPPPAPRLPPPLLSFRPEVVNACMPPPAYPDGSQGVAAELLGGKGGKAAGQAGRGGGGGRSAAPPHDSSSSISSGGASSGSWELPEASGAAAALHPAPSWRSTIDAPLSGRQLALLRGGGDSSGMLGSGASSWVGEMVAALGVGAGAAPGSMAASPPHLVPALQRTR